MDIVFNVVLPASLAFIMFALGLGLTGDDFVNVLRKPKAFAVGAFSQIVVIPVVAYLIVVAFRIPPELALGIMILSLCPGGPTTNMLTRLGLGDLALSVSLTSVLSLTSVMIVPVLVTFFAWHFLTLDAPPVSVTSLALTLFLITTVPAVMGMTVRRFYSGADVLERRALTLAAGLFLTIVIGALAANWTLFITTLPVLGPAMATLIVVLLAMGVLLARIFSLDRAQATSIAIDTGIQNGTLGVTVGLIMAGNVIGTPFAMPSAIYGIVMYLFAIPFALWRRSTAA